MTDKEKLNKMKKLADAMYTAAQYLTTDASGLRKAMDEYHRFIIYEYNKQDPASPCENCEGNGLPGTCASISSLGRCPLEYNKEPASEDLEKEIDEWLDKKDVSHVGRGDYGSVDMKKTARHFAQWGAEHVKKSDIPLPVAETCKGNGDSLTDEDLEQASIEHTHKVYNDTAPGERIAACRYDFKAGAQWQKEQMMKDAIGATALNSDYPTRLELNTKLNNVNAMDEVKVIIIKE